MTVSLETEITCMQKSSTLRNKPFGFSYEWVSYGLSESPPLFNQHTDMHTQAFGNRKNIFCFLWQLYVLGERHIPMFE